MLGALYLYGAHQYIRLPTPGRLPKLGIYPNVGVGVGVGVGVVTWGWRHKSGAVPLLLVPE